MDEIEKSHKSIDFENLIYNFKGLIANADFNDLIDAEALYSKYQEYQEFLGT